MSASERTSRALTLLLSAGVLGISSALVATHGQPTPASEDNTPVADRLSNIREAVSASMTNPDVEPATQNGGAKLLLAKWLNFGGGMGWRNGGWRNWHNWHNGGWGNGGWGNGGWGNGWHNGWHNYWHNW